MTFSSDGKVVASGGNEQRTTLRGHTDVVYALAFSPDNQSLASSGRDRMIHLWDVPSGLVRATLQGHSAEINGLAFDPASRLLATTSSDQTIRLWDLASEEAPELIVERVSLVDYGEADGLAIAFSPDGFMLAGGCTHIVLVWEMASGGQRQLRHTFKAHTSWVLALAFSPDGRTLTSAGSDMSICLWDLHKGELSHKIQETTRVPNAVVFSADGAQLFSANDDGAIVCWDAASGKSLQSLCSEEPYAGMNISGVTGISEAQKEALLALGAVESG